LLLLLLIPSERQTRQADILLIRQLKNRILSTSITNTQLFSIKGKMFAQLHNNKVSLNYSISQILLVTMNKDWLVGVQHN